MSNPAPAIEELLRQRAWLERFVATLVVDAADADDLAQETLLAALERPPQRLRQPRAWLGTVANHLLQRLRGRDRSRSERERSVATPEALTPTDEVVARANLHRAVVDAVLALVEPYRTAVLLRFFEDLPPRAIAQRTRAPVETVNTRIKRGVELVRAELVQRRGGAAGNSQGPSGSIGLHGLVGLLTPCGRHVVRRALASKAAGAGAGAGVGLGEATVDGRMGVLGMSAKLKLAAAGIVAACGTFAVVKLCEKPGLPASDGIGSLPHGRPELPTPATIDATPRPALAEPTRAVEVAAPLVAKSAPTVAPERLALSGSVRTAAGGPAGGAVVVIEAVGPRSAIGRLDNLIQDATDYLDLAPGSHGRIRSTLTGADGSFRFESVTVGTHVNVAAIDRREGLGLASGLEFDAARASAPLEIVLLGGVVLHGRVRDGDDRPIVGAYGNAIAIADGEVASTAFTRVSTDSSGEYTTLPLPFRCFYLEFNAEGYRQHIRAPVRIEVGERDHREDFTLLKPQAFGGRILVADGRPAGLAETPQKCLVLLSFEDPREGLLSPTFGITQKGKILLEEDRYRFEERWFGTKFVSLWCERTLLGTAAIADEHAGPDLVVDLAAQPPPSPPRRASLRLEVVDTEDGGPVLDFQVIVKRDLREELELNPQSIRGESHDAGGRLEVPNLLLGRYDVALRAEGYAPAFLTGCVSDDPNLAPVHVELRKAVAPLRGRVLDEQGQPVAQADVSLLAPDGRAAMPFPDYRARTGANGTFAFAAIPEGDYFVCAEAQGLAPSAAPAAAGDEDVVLTLRAGVLVKLEGRFGGKTYWGMNSVEIRDEQGAPVVDLARPGASIGTGAVGQVPTRLAPGTYTLFVTAPGFHADPVQFTAAPGASVTVDLVRDAPLTPGR